MSRSLASSLAVLALMAAGWSASRPHYGGLLRIETRAAANSADSPVRTLVFETLTALDDSGRLQPALATRWESQGGDRRWQFWLRPGVRFHDGTPFTSSAVTASLTAGGNLEHPWISARALSDSVLFEFADSRPNFAAELALAHYSIEHAQPNSMPAGTGPYRWGEPHNGATVLQANDDYWGGRPFTNTVEVITSRLPRDQIADLELGRSDIIEVGPEHLRRVAKARTTISQPAELIAVVVHTAKPIAQDPRFRHALALSIDRDFIYNVVLQKQGEITGGLLPNWISGYAFLLSQSRDTPGAQKLTRELGTAPPLTIAAPASDTALQLIADRIALNASEAGIAIQPASGQGTPDLTVTRFALASLDPGVALDAMLSEFGTVREPVWSPAQKLYEQERAFVAQERVIPLAYVPRVFGLSPRVRNWSITPDGRWRLAGVWLSPAEAAK